MDDDDNIIVESNRHPMVKSTFREEESCPNLDDGEERNNMDLSNINNAKVFTE